VKSPGAQQYGPEPVLFTVSRDFSVGYFQVPINNETDRNFEAIYVYTTLYMYILMQKSNLIAHTFHTSHFITPYIQRSKFSAMSFLVMMSVSDST
jgi:hypothetical protein